MPLPVLMEIVPEAEPGITIPTKVLPVLETTMAVAPPIVKAVGLPKLVPVIVTKVPGLPIEGAKDVMVGVAASFVSSVISFKEGFELLSFFQFSKLCMVLSKQP